MTQFKIVYGPAESPVTETIDADQIVEEEGIVVFFKGDEALMRVQKENLHNAEDLPIER
ncbi:hypothetical protein [Actinomadura rupiterrae]|uniref:hypothetical protein n=1 Tax=Actinomadura rupiterrae TaxID=559627 RepID=UPI0020A273E1|nr:hypothetical protein [Actinomadura rupiterrae]MCP2343070.1 hypothetical protein [Actinomadura rupiterrae]